MVKGKKGHDKYKTLFWIAIGVIAFLLITFVTMSFYVKGKVEDFYQSTNNLSRISDPSYVGLSLEKAQDTAHREKLELRIVRHEGLIYALNDDYRTNRVNVSVEDGRVVKAERY